MILGRCKILIRASTEQIHTCSFNTCQFRRKHKYRPKLAPIQTITNTIVFKLRTSPCQYRHQYLSNQVPPPAPSAQPASLSSSVWWAFAPLEHYTSADVESTTSSWSLSDSSSFFVTTKLSTPLQNLQSRIGRMTLHDIVDKAFLPLQYADSTLSRKEHRWPNVCSPESADNDYGKDWGMAEEGWEKILPLLQWILHCMQCLKIRYQFLNWTEKMMANENIIS